MTVLVVGGRGQGKKELMIRMFGLQKEDILNGSTCEPEALEACRAINGLHLLTRRMLHQGRSLEELRPLLRDKIVICDELGCGVVPVERELENWREFTGRLCCDLAAEAELVIRVVAGLPQAIKGNMKKTDEIF